MNACSIEADDVQNVYDECAEKIREVEKTKDLFGLNDTLKTRSMNFSAYSPESIFSNEVARRLSENRFTVSKDDGFIKALTNNGFEVKVLGNGLLEIPADCPFGSYSQIEKFASETAEYCAAYENAVKFQNE